jgi:predicted permease
MKWGRTKKRDTDLARELQSDLELEEEELRASGMPAEEAHYAARRAFGNTTLIREQTHEVWSWSSLENLLRDLRISARALLRAPGFSLVAILVMALCIGAATSLFTVVRSVLLRPLPFRDPDRLVMVYEHFRDPAMNTKEFNFNTVAPADFYDWRSQTHGFEDMAAWRWSEFNLAGEHGDLPELVTAGGASWNLFPLLGVPAALGRTFTESEDRTDGTAVMLSWSLYERRFGADQSIVGKQIHLDGKPYTVVGVLPKWFIWPDAKMQVWVTYASGMPPEVLKHHDFHYTRVVARMRPDVSLASALGQVGALQYQIHMQNLHAPVAEDVAPKTLLDDLSRNVKKPLLILLCAVVCMLLIGCLNVANLMVARSAARQRDIAIRGALGAQRATLIRAQLIESLLISLTGGICGILLSLAATHFLVTAWRDIPSAESIHVDGVVLAFACALIIATALLAGLFPAIASTARGTVAALQASSRSTAGSQSRTALRKTLLTVEIAATVVLLIGAGLLAKSFWRLRTTDLGCVTDNVLTMSYSLPMQKYDSPAKVNAFNEALHDRIAALPGVRAVAMGTKIPGAGSGEDDVFRIAEHPPVPAGVPLPDALYRSVSPDYFSALQIPLLQGRFFTKDDRFGHPKTTVINHFLAQQYFPGENPIGKHLKVPSRGEAVAEVVGVVADTLSTVGQPAIATMYVPLLDGANDGSVTLGVRTASDPLAYSVPIQKQLATIDPDLPVSDVLTMQETIARSLGNASLSASLVLMFAMLSLMLASIGLYGVLSYLTTQRSGEIGLRLALGAQRTQVVRLMLSDGLRPALYGLVLGLAASVGAVRLVESMLYETQPLDPAIFAAVAATLLAVAALACFVPAWKASRIDPMQALRME